MSVINVPDSERFLLSSSSLQREEDTETRERENRFRHVAAQQEVPPLAFLVSFQRISNDQRHRGGGLGKKSRPEDRGEGCCPTN